jgi:hypothetical protein
VCLPSPRCDSGEEVVKEEEQREAKAESIKGIARTGLDRDGAQLARNSLSSQPSPIMSEPSDNLDLTALSDALGEDDRQAMAKASERITSQDKQPASIATPSRSSTTSPPVAHSHNTATADIPAAPPKPPQAETLHPDPNVQNIKAMFPDMDVDTIQAVLVADGGDFERGKKQGRRSYTAFLS